MATARQRKAAEKLVENGGSVSKAMREAGYSPATAKTPSKLTESRGFLQLCDDLGLTDDLIVRSLVEDIKTKPGERKSELELAAKMRGRIQNKVEVDIPDVKRLLDKIETDYEEVGRKAREQMVEADPPLQG